MFADSLAKTLTGQSVDVERTGIAAAATTADVLLPDLIVLAADAAQSRGSAVLAQLKAAGRTTPTLVISAAEAGGLVPVQAAAHVAYITPAGGVIDCAGRLRALLGALLEDQTAGASLQKLTDKVTGRGGKTTATGAQPRAAAPAKTSPGFPTPLSAAGSKAPEAAAQRAAQISVQPGGAVAKPTGAVKTTGASAALGSKPAKPDSPATQQASKPGEASQAAKSTGGIKAGGADTAATAKATGPVKTTGAEANAAQAKPTGTSKTEAAAQAKPTGASKTAGLEASATQAKSQPGKAANENAQQDAAAPLKDTSPIAAKLATPSAAPASDKGAPGKPLPLSAAGGTAKPGISLGPSARSLTNRPVTVQPPPAASASPPSRTMNTPSLAAKPALASSASMSRGTTGQQPAALRGAQAALTTSPAPAQRQVELPTLRPTTPNSQEPVSNGAQTVRPASSPQEPKAAANDQGQPPEGKTAPRIPLRAQRAASTHAPASDARAAVTAAPPQPSDRGVAVAAQPAAIASPPVPSAARQVSDSEVEIILSDRPVSLTPKLLPADTNPPPPTPPQRPQPVAATTSAAITPNATREPQAQPAARATGAVPQSPPEPPPQTNPRIPRIPGATQQTNANAARPPLEPAPQANAPATRTAGSIDQSIPAGTPRLVTAQYGIPRATHPTGASAHNMPAAAARDPLEPATRTTGSINQSTPAGTPRLVTAQYGTPQATHPTGATAHMPAEPAQLAGAPATRTTGSFNQNTPAGAPRNPLEPAQYANAPATRITGAVNQSMPAGAPRNPLEPAQHAGVPVTQPTGAIAPSMPASAARNPLDPAPFAGAPARRTTGSFNQSIPAGGPRNPLDPAARATHTTGSVPRMTSGAPRHPFDPAPRELEPERSATVRNMPSGAPRYPFDHAPRASVDPSAAPAHAPRDPLTSAAPSGNPQPSASRRTGANPTRRAGRAPTDPFQAAAPQPQAATPQGLPDLALPPAADTPYKPHRWRGAWLMGAVAAIGCSAFWLYQTYDSSAARAPGNAATGALSQTPPLNTLPVDHAAPPAISPQPTNAPSVEPESAAPAANAERRAGSTRRAGESQDTDTTTATGRARGLVDSGSAMLRQGRYGIAEGMYMKALQEVPEYPPAMAELVRVHLARKDGKEAVRWAELLVAKQSNGLHQLLLGDAQALRGNTSAAQAAWTKAAKAGNATAQQRLAADEEEEE